MLKAQGLMGKRNMTRVVQRVDDGVRLELEDPSCSDFGPRLILQPLAAFGSLVDHLFETVMFIRGGFVLVALLISNCWTAWY